MTITDRIAFHTNTPDLSPVVNRAIASGAKSLLLLCYTGDGVNIIRAVRTAKAPLLILGSGAWNPTIIKMGQPGEGVLALSDWNEDLPKPGVAPFLAGFQKAYGQYPGIAAAWGWSDMYFVKAALEKAGSAGPTKAARHRGRAEDAGRPRPRHRTLRHVRVRHRTGSRSTKCSA